MKTKAIIFLILAGVIFFHRPVYSLLADKANINSLKISIASFASLDKTQPVSTITNTDYTTSITSYRITYTVVEDNFKTIKLCHSFDLGFWQCPDSYIFDQNTGYIDFTFPSKGTYYFATIATDAFGNVEDKYLENPIFLNPFSGTYFPILFQ